MAEQNPIRYSDLIQPDESISNLVKQLDEANDAYSNLAKSIQSEAQRMATSLQMVSGATSVGRTTIKGMSQDAEKLLKAERDLNFARSETARKIAELKAMQKDEQTITKLTIQLNRASAGSYEALSAQYSLNKIRLNAMTEDMRKNTEQGRKLEAETRDIYERMNELQKATGKYTLEVGNYEKAVGQLMGVQGRWMQNLQMLQGLFANGLTQGLKQAGTAVAGFGKQMLALLANPVVAAIAAIAAAFLALSNAISSSEQNTRALERIMAPFQRVLTAVGAALQEVATFLLKGVEGMENMAMAASRFAERLPIVGRYLKQVNDALEDNIRLTKEKQDLEDQERAYLVQNAQLMANSAKYRADAEKTSDPKRRAMLLKMAQQAETTAYLNEIDLAKKDLAIKQQLAAQSQNDKKTNDELAQAQARLANLQQNYYQRQIRLNAKLRKENEKLNKPSGKGGSVNAEVDNEQKIADEKIAIAQKTQDIKISMLEDAFTKEYQTVEVGYQRQIDALIAKGEKEVALRSEIDEQIKALVLKRDMELANITIKYAEKDAAAIAKMAEDKKKAEEQIYRDNVQLVNDTSKLRVMEIDNMQVSEQRKTQLRLQAERERLQKIYDMNVQAGKDVNSLEMKMLKEQMKNIENQTKKSGFNMFDMLGFNLTDEKKAGITSTFDFAIGQLNDYLNAWVQAADAKAQLAEKEVERAQSVLQAEMEARNAGYASDVETARKELELAKKNQEQALKEREKAQKAQLLMDSITQASNLISASALIWSQLGFPWAIPALAVMWGSFAASKIKAAELTKVQNETYGEGTVELLDGGSHQSGNDVDLGRKKDGTRRRAEGGEFFAVINKRNSRRFRSIIPDVVHSLNDGTFADKYMNAYGGGAVMVNMQQKDSDLRRLSDDVHSIREQGESRSFTDERGTHVVYKNLHRIYKN